MNWIEPRVKQGLTDRDLLVFTKDITVERLFKTNQCDQLAVLCDL